MSGRPNIEITESLEQLTELMKSQKKVLNHSKIHALYLIKSKQVETVREIAKILSKGETTIHRWFGFYREGGIDLLLLEKKSPGRPKILSVEEVARIQQELRDPEGFKSYKEITFWLNIIQGITCSYQTVYKTVTEELNAKLKVARPRNKNQEPGAIEEYQSQLSEKLERILEEAEEKVKKYEKVSFWCSDESRFGLHTVQRRKITLPGIKPLGINQFNFKYFWMYGAVEPTNGRHFFYGFSHLDSICFSQYLEEFSKAYPNELLIMQVDNAGSHTSELVEIPENIILLFQPPYSPETNPIERVWQYLKDFLAWELFDSLDSLRTNIQKRLSSLSEPIVASIAGWSWILHSLSLSFF
jgi:transposase